jgi:hypothetical protein
VVNAGAMCDACESGERHWQFVTLLRDGRLPHDVGRPVGEWDFSRQPIAALHCHNRVRRWRIGPKHTKHIAPHHVVALVIGPFACRAYVFRNVVRSGLKRCRTHTERATLAASLASVWHLLDATQEGTRVRVYREGATTGDHRLPDEHAMRTLLTAARQALATAL